MGDPANLASAFSGLFGNTTTYAPGTYGSIYDTPGTFYEYETGTTVPGAPSDPATKSPFYGYNQAAPNTGDSKTFDALTKAGLAAGKAGMQIGDYRMNKALGRQAAKIARREAFQKTMEGLKAASRARAVTGAQGRTGAGSPLLAELSSVEAASTDAKNRIFQGNIEQFGFNQRAKKNLYGAGGDVLEALLAGSSLFKET